MFPNQLRKYFAWFLVLENIQATMIWERFKESFCQDFVEDKENRGLLNINEILKASDSCLENFGLPSPKEISNERNDLLEKEKSKNEYKLLFQSMFKTLTEDQNLIFYDIVNGSKLIHFLDGPGGSGKTYLYKTIIYYYLSIGKIILPMSWTGIAAVLLPKGTTSHRIFRIPINYRHVKFIHIDKEVDKKRLREAHVFLLDESSNIPQEVIDLIDALLQDLCNNSLPFGGKMMIFGGDFRQILPVIKNSFRTDIVRNTIKCSSLWPFFNKLSLSKNIRCQNHTFSSFLLDIGEGRIQHFKIPKNWLTVDVCRKIYGGVDPEQWLNRVILSSHNEQIQFLNKKVLTYLPGDVRTYYSVDNATHKGVDQSDDNIYLNYPIEYLNSITEGLPPHRLELKINAIVMLIRNISVIDGLCNGTRLKIIKLLKYNIQAEIITGDNIGSKFFIPRITLNTGESTLPFILYRKQFPIVLAFCMTINKSQGQSFDSVGIYIKRPLFSHGQLYVALSRCRNPNSIFIQNESDDKSGIDNIVWDEVLEN